MKLLLILLSSFILNPTFATEKKWIHSAADKKIILVKYAEGDRFFIERFEIPRGEYQEKTFSKTFSKESDLNNWLKKFLKNNPSFQEFIEIESYQISTIPQITDQKIWEPTEKWNWDWEKKYADWISINGTIDFFQKYNIKTDCADVAYAYRWIFAYIHKLPMGNQLAGSSQLFSHNSFLKKWKKLPRSQNWWQDQVFLAALDYLLDNTYTHSLIKDSYPIQISTESMLPGVHHLDIRPHSGHTLLLVKTNFTEEGDTLSLISSTVPRAVRELSQSGYWYEIQPKKIQNGGFLRMKWLEFNSQKWQFVPSNKHPFFSIEQYQPEFMQNFDLFYDAVQSRLNAFHRSPIGQTKSLINQLIMTLYERTSIVSNGYFLCLELKCHPGDETYEAWSTPNRDARILKIRLKINQFLNEIQDPELWNLWNNLSSEKFEYFYDVSTETVFEVDFDFIFFNIRNKKLSHDPRDSIFKRWGLSDPTPTPLVLTHESRAD